MKNVACITGITGQTGSYLAEILLAQGYKVYGLKRRSSSFNTERLNHIYLDPHNHPNLELIYGDLSDYSSIASFIADAKPELFFNMAAQSHVRVSFDIPENTFDVDSTGVMRCLEAIRKYSPTTRFLQASSSEMFGSTPPPQNELTPFHPRSPYAVAKVAGYWSTVNYREAYGMFATNAISFNHESPRRGETFVTRKITRGITRIKLGLQDKLYLGNLDAKRDWSHAKDMANAMYKIITAENPEDYVVASGEMHSVQEFLDLVCNKLGVNYKDHIEIDPRYFRPSEVDALCGDASKLITKLNWKPEYTFDMLVEEMIKEDWTLALNEKLIKDKG
ncbi:MAG TPA: GDP-mannose 4,6-dehydratase [Anaerovoracaceae bacterium]|nr:GDP-mannose 4,6-dehydratase [Anaerovoracaceae bacterium]